ncbi:MAG: hypothetical protein FWH05_04700 [Oscillospiraceae bacterium]|nr:hypothetical protein [Oscillospiraceae bacterium]
MSNLSNQIYYDYAVDSNGKARLSEFKYGNRETGEYFCEMDENGELRWNKFAPNEFVFDVMSNEFERLQSEAIMTLYGVQQEFKAPLVQLPIDDL